MKQIKIKKNSKKVKIYLENNLLNVVGPLGKVTYIVNNLNLKNENFFLKKKEIYSFKKIIKSLIVSVTKGWYLELNLNGVGYKCFKNKEKKGITFDLGYSALIDFVPNNKLKIKILKNKILLFSLERDYLNNVAYFIKNLVKLNPYKGKGILYKNEIIKLKKKNSYDKFFFLNKNKNSKLRYYLENYYGLGYHNADLICKTLGYNIHTRINELTDKDWEKLESIIKIKYKFLLNEDVKKTKWNNIRDLKNMRSYRGSRHFYGLPANNRRTRTNAQTIGWK